MELDLVEMASVVEESVLVALVVVLVEPLLDGAFLDEGASSEDTSGLA